MKVSFENLGIVKKADIDLSKKLLVFCGPNGTGKTYVSYAVYGYLSPRPMPENNIFEWEELLEKKELKITLNYDMLYEFKQNFIEGLSIDDIFGIYKNDSFSKFSFKTKSKSDFKKSIRNFDFITTFNLNGSSILYSKESDSDVLHIQLIASETVHIDSFYKINIVQNAALSKFICFQSIIRSYILPVERNSVYTFANELSRNKITSGNKNRYPLAIEDTLAIAVDLNYIKTREAKYKWLAEEIENNILQGHIHISDTGELQFSPKNSENLSLPVHLSASFIKNLSGLLIYLRHQAEEGELLIIDEPELGLHPDNQILLARIFARLVNNGIRLLISTHSDYIIRELNNLIMLSSDKAGIKQNSAKWGYKEDEKIKPEIVGAYLFDFDKKENSRVVVKPLDVNEKGFEVETIDRAINLLNENSENIFYTLKYGEED